MGAQGTATLNFGAFPGSSHASVSVTGQTSIVAGSLVEAWLRPETTADHSADEHMLETLKVFAADIVAGVGFTIHGFNSSEINEREPPQFFEQGNALAGQQRGPRHAANYSEGKGTRLYGAWSVAWVWN